MRSSRRWWLWNSVTKPHGRGAITRTPENFASFLPSPGILTFEKKRRSCYGRLRKIEEMINTHKEVPMKVIDLTHYIEPNILAYPGTEPPWTSSRRSSSWARRCGKDTYFGNYPCLNEDVMDYILGGDFKGIGFDVIGLDPIADENLTRHKKLFLHKDILNIENLCILGECGSDLFHFSCFPLKISDCDGSPIRTVARFD